MLENQRSSHSPFYLKPCLELTGKMQESRHIWPPTRDQHKPEDGDVYGNCGLWGSSSCCVTAAFWGLKPITWCRQLRPLFVSSSISQENELDREERRASTGWLLPGTPVPAHYQVWGHNLQRVMASADSHLPNPTHAPLLATLSQNHREKGILV